jgi:hypothetical protein
MQVSQVISTVPPAGKEHRLFMCAMSTKQLKAALPTLLLHITLKQAAQQALMHGNEAALDACLSASAPHQQPEQPVQDQDTARKRYLLDALCILKDAVTLLQLACWQISSCPRSPATGSSSSTMLP